MVEDLAAARAGAAAPSSPSSPSADPAAARARASSLDLAWHARRRTLLVTSGLILSSELCERLAYYSLSTNLVGRLTSLGMPAGAASSAVAGWQGAAYLVTVPGAWLADAVVGRFWVVVGGSLVYQIGLAAVVAVTALKVKDAAAAALLGALAVCALGTGGIKASVGSFGAEQFDPSASPSEARALGRYFNFFYFSINLGALVASTVVVWVQEQVSWVAGYSIPAAAFALSFALFLAGSRLYVRVPPKKGPFARVFRVLWRALWSRRKAVVPEDPRELFQSDGEEEAEEEVGRRRERRGGDGGESGSAKASSSSPSRREEEEEGEEKGGEEVERRGERRGSGVGKSESAEVASSSSSSRRSLSSSSSAPVSHTNYAVWLDRAAVKDGDNKKEEEEPPPKAGIKKRPRKNLSSTSSSLPCTLSAVEDAKRCLAYLTVCSSLVLFWLVYSQMTTAFVLQGNAGFDRRIGSNFEVPSASLSSFNTLAVLVLVPAYDALAVPLVRRLRAKKVGKTKTTVGGGVDYDGSPTHLERIGAGLAVSVLAMLAGAAAEAWRSGRVERGLGQPSVFCLAPQYFLVGAAEVLCSIGALDLAFTDAPDSMRSLLSAASLLSVAVGNFAASGVTAAVERGGGASGGWLPDVERGTQGRLVPYYLMLAGVSAVNFLFFAGIVARKYEYKRRPTVKRKVKRSPLDSRM